MAEAATILRLCDAPDEQLVECLRDLLARAESGELRHLSYIGAMTGNLFVEGCAGVPSDNYAMAGRYLAMAVNHARGF